MNVPVSLAQINTLLEWAEQWGREAHLEGAGEVAFLLCRSAIKMAETMGCEYAIPQRVSASVDASSGAQPDLFGESGNFSKDGAEVRQG